MDTFHTVKEENVVQESGLFHLSMVQFCVAAVFLALTCMATMLVQIPIPLGYAHLGDSVILVCAYFFGPVVGALAGGLGSALADILTGYAIWAVPTLLIKTIMPLIACAVFRNRTIRRNIYSLRVIGGAVLTLLFMTAGYVVFGALLYGSVAAGLASAPGLLVKSVVNLFVFLFIGTGLSKVLHR